MLIEPKVRGFICTAAHPDGCAAHVDEQIAFVRAKGAFEAPKRVLVVGSSTGYGLASRIALAFGAGAKTLGVAFDKPARAGRTATAGWYNTAAFERRAGEAGLWAESLNGDAFSDALKAQAAARIREAFGQVDLLVYSIASPVRTDPKTGVTYRSVIRPVGEPFTNKTVNVAARTVNDITVEPASPEEVEATVKVMGGEDWRLWVEELSAQGLLAPGFRTVAYSYIGPAVTHAVYRDGTIGLAKNDLAAAAKSLTESLAPLGGAAFVSVNKALVTQASSAIPVVPLYISILYRVMKDVSLHEGTIEQMRRLFAEKLTAAAQTDAQGFVRLDDWELRPDVQAEVDRRWARVSTETLPALCDIEGYEDDFYRLFGFRVKGVDYTKETDENVHVPSIPEVDEA